ncbi:MAG: hypothetical protein ACE5K2_06135 [Candidatus Zixiibacteriota bacterium]
MKGVQFVVDDSGRKTAVVIDLKKYGQFWEDFYDHLLIEQSRDKPRKDLEEVKIELKKEGKL